MAAVGPGVAEAPTGRELRRSPTPLAGVWC